MVMKWLIDKKNVLGLSASVKHPHAPIIMGLFVFCCHGMLAKAVYDFCCVYGGQSSFPYQGWKKYNDPSLKCTWIVSKCKAPPRTYNYGFVCFLLSRYAGQSSIWFLLCIWWPKQFSLSRVKKIQWPILESFFKTFSSSLSQIYTHWNRNSKLNTKLRLEFQIEYGFKLEF